jgi:hypothetical protein
LPAIDAKDKQGCKADKDPAKYLYCNRVVLRKDFNNSHKQIWKRHPMLVVQNVQIRKGQCAVHNLLNKEDILPIIPMDRIHGECVNVVQKQ